MNSYYSKEELSAYQFYKLPKKIFSDERFRQLSLTSKVLYSMLLDRASLSSENGFTDKLGRVFVFMTNSEACSLLSCSHEKVSKLFKELENADLIERKKQGLCRTYVIYPKLPG